MAGNDGTESAAADSSLPVALRFDRGQEGREEARGHQTPLWRNVWQKHMGNGREAPRENWLKEQKERLEQNTFVEMYSAANAKAEIESLRAELAKMKRHTK